MTTTKLVPTGSTALADGSTPTIRFGVILNVNGTSVPIASDDITHALTNGVEFTLQNPLDLGSINDFMTWAHGTWGVPLLDSSSLPPPLDKVVDAMTNIDVTIEKLHLKVPAKTDTSGVKYTFGANGMLGSEIPIIAGKLGIDGFVFGFSNEGPPAAP